MDLLDFPRPLTGGVAKRLFPAIELRLANTLLKKRKAINTLWEEFAEQAKDYFERVGEIDTLTQNQLSPASLFQLLRATVPETSSPTS